MYSSSTSSICNRVPPPPTTAMTIPGNIKRVTTSNEIINTIRDIDHNIDTVVSYVESIDSIQYNNISKQCTQFISQIDSYVHRLNVAIAHHTSASNSPIDGETSNMFDTMDDYTFKKASNKHGTALNIRKPPPPVPTSKPNNTNFHAIFNANGSHPSATTANDTAINHHTSSSAVYSTPPHHTIKHKPLVTPGEYATPIVIDGVNENVMHIDGESDEAMARRLQVEMEREVANERLARINNDTTNDDQHELLKLTCSCHVCNNIITDVNKLLEIDACNHRVCIHCMSTHLQSSINTVDTKCPVISNNQRCKQTIPDWMQRRVLSNDEFDKLQQLILQAYFTRSGSAAVTCPNPQCGNTFEAVAGNVDDMRQDSTVELGISGQPLTRDAYVHRAKHRFRCSRCSIEFCSGCSTTPYHLGYTCQQYKLYLTAAKCRFCEQAITPEMTQQLEQMINGPIQNNDNTTSSNRLTRFIKNHPTPPKLVPTDICSSSECYANRLEVCSKILSCTHPCNGILNEKQCTGCLHNECSGIDGTQYCSICYTDALHSAPCIQLQCKHVYHYKCVLSKIQKQWTGARITFGFLNCPECRAEISHISLDPITLKFRQLKQIVQDKAVARLKYEGCENDTALIEPSSRYYNQQIAYSMDRFAYYPCSKCGLPYFGGRRQCEDVNENNDKFNRDELICGGCVSGSDTLSCKLHGKEYIDYKCKFCCGIANYFCWGSTHFCESCHSKQIRGEYVTRIPIDKLPKCSGAKTCPLGIDHPPAGQEYALGCSICRPRFN